MSITAAISNALSGLSAVSRGTEVVSSNLANALTPGYGARELSLSSRSTYNNGGGVHIDGINRNVPAAILADTRKAQAGAGNSSTIFEFYSAMESAFGMATKAGSLSDTVVSFDSALASAAASPDSDARLSAVLDGAMALSNKINSISGEIEATRSAADKKISSDVDRLNTALSDIARLNRLITVAQSKGEDVSSLVDMRQSSIDAVAEIVPIQEVARSTGQIALFTKGGAALLDGTKPAEITFSASGTVTANMSVSGGQLGRILFNGVPLSDGQLLMFKGGSLEANFKIRDDLAPSYQQQIDAYAANLYTRLSSPNVDSSISTGEPGIFTDLQAAFSSADEVGFSSRIRINDAMNPSTGGELRRVRDGIYTATAGDVGNSTVFNAIRLALGERNAASLPGRPSANHTAFTLASDLMSIAASDRIKGESSYQYDKTYLNGMTSSLLSYGVDSDKELEGLLQLENAYTANAKVLQAAHEMLQIILSIK